MKAVAVTGLGVVASLGDDVATFWASLAEGRSGLAPLARLRTPVLARCPAGQLSPATRGEHAGDRDPCGALAAKAARQAWRQATLEAVAPDRVAVVLGTSAAGMTPRSKYERERDRLDSRGAARLLAASRPHEAVRHVAEELGATGPRFTVSTACTSSTIAVAHAMQLLRAGRADVVLAGGVDWIVEELAAGFLAIGAMSDEACDPFGASRGMNLGEGAGFVALERADHARRRGARTIVALTGFGLAADAYHATSPDPTGDGSVRAIRGAVDDAGITPAQVDWFDAHGTGTDANDAAEQAALVEVFGERAGELEVTAFKRHLGHGLGAGGILELIALVGESKRRGHRGSGQAVSHGAAFGGSYAALVVGEPPAARRRAVRDEGVVVLGWHRLAPSTGEQIVPDDRLAVRGDARLGRRADRLTRLLFGAVAGALDHAGLRVGARGGPGRVATERIGLFVGTGQLPAEPAETFWRSALERGFDRASGPAFSRMVLNAPAGAVGRALELRGPLSVLADGRGAGLAAVILAGDLLRQRGDVDVMVVASAFEVSRVVFDALGDGRDPPVESSAAVVLARARWVRHAGSPARLRVGAAAFGGTPDADEPRGPPNDAADMVSLVDACARASRGEVRHLHATSDAGTPCFLSLAPMVGATTSPQTSPHHEGDSPWLKASTTGSPSGEPCSTDSSRF